MNLVISALADVPECVSQVIPKPRIAWSKFLV